ncbi:kinesin-like protein KIF20A isoform X2 [Megalopta genalis]|uniref:kinesin-like protein KIF20A isoform X2 n=1 Tax=Megalopta genalis TaxID=115081 RepID=UPI003FD67D1A
MSVYEIEESNFLEETNSESKSFQTIKGYLRLKPFPKQMKLTQELEQSYKILNSSTLLTKLPTLDNTSSFLKRSNSNDIVQRKFTFTRTFGPEINQLELFEQAVKQQMVDFLAGTTSSGKSFTLQGSITSPGIIPRCLEFVFSNITSKPSPPYKPVNHCDVVSLGPLERAQELEMKTKLQTFALLSAAQKDVCTGKEATFYVEELKSQLFAKEDQVKKLKVFLNEAKEEYITITTEIREKEYTIKEQEEELLEKQETIDDLEADLVNINICLTKECKGKEALDEELENQNKKLLDYERKMQNMLQIINKLECEKLELLNEA